MGGGGYVTVERDAGKVMAEGGNRKRDESHQAKKGQHLLESPHL